MVEYKSVNATGINHLVDLITAKYSQMPAKHAMLVGISGIDASGKGYVTAKLAEELTGKFNIVSDRLGRIQLISYTLQIVARHELIRNRQNRKQVPF